MTRPRNESLRLHSSNAQPETSVRQLIDVAFSRWRVERCFLDKKQEIRLDAWEERRYIGLKRHLILSSVSYLFLARVRSRRREKNPELTICQVHNAVAALVQSRWLGRRASSALLDHVAEGITYKQRRNALA